MNQGDIGDCMFIIYSGMCGVYRFNNTDPDKTNRAFATLGPNTEVGSRAVVDRKPDKRMATVMAHNEVIALKLTKQDFQNILFVQ